MTACNICSKEFDDEDEDNQATPFCGYCFKKWDNTLRICNQFSDINPLSISADARFDNKANTYTKEASIVVQDCLSQVVARDPVVEESLDALRRKQYKKLQKFDPSKLDHSL